MLVGLVVNSFGLFHTYIAQSLDVSRTAVAFTQTVQSISGAIALMFSARIMRRVPFRALASACAAIISGALMLASAFKSIYPFYFAWAAIGFCMPFLYSLTIPTVLSNWFERLLGTVMGVAVSLTGVGGAFFNPLIARFLQRFGWRPVLFAVGAFIALCLLPLALFVLRYSPGPGETPYGRAPELAGAAPADTAHGMTSAEARRTPSFYLFVVAVLFLGLPSGFFQQISPHVMSLGHPVTTGASVMSGVMLGIAAGKLVIGRLLDRLKAAHVLAGFSLIGATGWIGLTFAGLPAALVACGFCAGMGHGISQVALPVAVRRAFGTREYGKIYAVITSCTMVISACSPTAGSMVYDLTGSYTLPLRIAGSAFGAALPCLILAIQFAQKRAKPE